MAFQRGINEQQEQDPLKTLRDTRTLGQRFSAFFQDPVKSSCFLIIFSLVIVFFPIIGELGLIFSIIIFIYTLSQKLCLPFRLPERSKRLDYNDKYPGGNKARVARGIYFFGNEKHKNDELWFANDDMRTHALIFGSTGSGKTESLVSIAYNALVQASGFIYVDGKGDNGLFAKVFSMVRSMGREDDMLLINFMTGARDIIGPQKKRLSNTMNPFASGSSSMLSTLIVSLMGGSGKSGDGDMWKGRAIGFVEALMRVLVAMRDAGNILLDANTIRNYFLLPRLEAMVVDKLFIRDGQESVNLESLPPSLLEPISNYVYNLPGYNVEKKGKQVSQVLEQHGFITMQLTRAFTSLADTYGHILRTNLAEVDLADVVLNRRILCVLLPALEKSPDELSNLGKVIIATLKAMMAGGLGDSVEGELRDIVDSKPTNADTPFLCILDEYGYYAVEGFAVVPAQARSLGFSVIFAGQDLPAFQKASKEEAASIGANTNIKICMKLEDPTDTWDFFMKSAGESYVSQVENFQVNTGSLTGSYADGRGARIEKRARIDLLDLKEQVEGDMHILFKSKIVRARVFYANPTPVKYMRLNHFLKVGMLDDESIKTIQGSLSLFNALDLNDMAWPDGSSSSEKLARVISNFEALVDHGVPLVQAVGASLGEVQREDTSSSDIPDDFLRELLGDEEVDIEHLNLFTPMRMAHHFEGVSLPDNLEFSDPLLSLSFTREKLEYIERLCGGGSQHALNVSVELVGDLEKGTHYPPDTKPDVSVDAVKALISKLVDEMKL